jgi:hypothetical protein
VAVGPVAGTVPGWPVLPGWVLVVALAAEGGGGQGIGLPDGGGGPWGASTGAGRAGGAGSCTVEASTGAAETGE